MSATSKVIAIITLAVAALLIFVRLGHYSLWDDEAVTAFGAEGVWKTGDTSVIFDHNVVAYRSGLLLSGTHERSTPPLPAYLAAPFVGIFGRVPGPIRFPFAVIGLCTVGLIMFWLYTLRAPWLTVLLMSMALVGNVCFWLYARQARYYSPVLFSSILIAYIYLNYAGKRWQLIVMAVAGLILLSSNYLNYFALHVCLLVDYVIIGRKRYLLSLKEWLIILLPQVLIGGVIFSIWNTLGTGNRQYLEHNSLGDRLYLIWMNLRDMNYSEFYSPLLLLAAPVLYFFTRQTLLLRGVLVYIGYIFLVSMLSPQMLTPERTEFADIRYLTPLIPLAMALSVMVLLEIGKLIARYIPADGTNSPVAVNVPLILLAVITFGTNLLNGAPFWKQELGMPVRSTFFSYLGELWTPIADPYEPASQWIRETVQPGQSIFIWPDYMTYPLMFKAPHALYAWQFINEFPPAFKDLSPIHLRMHSLPDYMMAFGPIYVKQLVQSIQLPPNINYPITAIIPVYWRDAYRPELFWHLFSSVPMNEEMVNNMQAVYCFRLVISPTTAPATAAATTAPATEPRP
ncbi:MAG TPA: hypothetical protein VHD56_10650 [Tepidisphaeraceae bacterium]|nr:hypothetical protein [Tepidisphaeraceae bacterium]